MTGTTSALKQNQSPNRKVRIIRPQEGFQMKASATSADIAILGGAAGLGKTFILLLESLRHKHNPKFGSVYFRRTTPQIRNEGGLWDTSEEIYPLAKAKPKQHSLEWEFPSGATVSFRHLEHEKDKLEWQGAQIPLLVFDELTHFTETMFFYMLSRNRSTCGVEPYVRATCNPDPDSWVAHLIEWWIDQETGFPIPERDGVLRYFARDGNNYIWGDSVEEVYEKGKYFLEEPVTASGLPVSNFIKSITFITGSIYGNKELLKVNPQYLGNLLSQDAATVAALFRGNWKAVVSADDIYDHAPFSGMFVNMFDVDRNNRYITADIATQGSDKFVVFVWAGMELIDVLIMEKSNGPEIIEGIAAMAKKHHVPNMHICYDNDGVGGMVDGFFPGSIPFHNGGAPLPGNNVDSKGNQIPENYKNLKTQCYYRSGESANKHLYSVSDEVQTRMYDDTMTVRQRLLFERKAIKKARKDDDGKLQIIKKIEMKVFLNGQSPDMMDAFMMRERFNLSVNPWV